MIDASHAVDTGPGLAMDHLVALASLTADERAELVWGDEANMAGVRQVRANHVVIMRPPSSTSSAMPRPLSFMEMVETSLREITQIVITEHGISPTLWLGSLPVSLSSERNGRDVSPHV